MLHDILLELYKLTSFEWDRKIGFVLLRGMQVPKSILYAQKEGVPSMS